MMSIVFLLIGAVLIFLDFLIAGWFFEAAKEKGYHDSKYFWICFWLSFAGYLLVIALPDRGNAPQAVSDELPDL